MASSPDEQIAFLKERMRDYFARLAALSANRPPPGTNAANGFWRDETDIDPDLKNLETKPPIELTGECLALQNTFASFQAKVRETFHGDQNYEAKWETSWQVFWPLFTNLSQELIKVIQDLFNLFSKKQEQQDAARTKIFGDLEALYKKVTDSGKVGEGRHANGHISEGVKAASDATIATLNAQMPKGQDSNVGRVADALRLVCEKLSLLPTDNHKPWLRADWQLSFQGACEVAAAGLA